ncbi:hypothetical protein ACVWZR_001976 [Bradyrhizobium sp. i1.3.1]
MSRMTRNSGRMLRWLWREIRGRGVSLKVRRKARNESLAVRPKTRDGYVSWERFEAIHTMFSVTLPPAGIAARPSTATRCCPL